MPFNVNAQRLEPGKYRFTYGRGRKQLVATAAIDGPGWKIVNGFAYSLDPKPALRDLKQAWAQVARQAYHGLPQETAGDTGIPPESPGPAPSPPDPAVEARRQAEREWHYSDTISLRRLVSLYGLDRVLAQLENFR